MPCSCLCVRQWICKTELIFSLLLLILFGEMKTEPASFPVVFFFSAFPFVRLFTSAKTKTSCPISEQKADFFFFEREYLHPQSTTREMQEKIQEEYMKFFTQHAGEVPSLQKKKKKCSALTRQCTKTLSITDSLNSNSHFHPRTTLSQCWFILLPFGNLKSQLALPSGKSFPTAVLKNRLWDVVEFRP